MDMDAVGQDHVHRFVNAAAWALDRGVTRLTVIRPPPESEHSDARRAKGQETREIASRLRGPYRPPQYRLVILPMVVLRRLDCVLEPTKDAVLKKSDGL